MPAERPDRQRRRRRWGVVALAGAVVAALCLGFFAGGLVASPEQVRASRDAPSPSVITAEVRRGRLTSTVIFRATVTRGRTMAVSPAVSGVVTSLPLARGAEVGAGTLLMTVNDRPVIALPGEVPLYRALRPGDSGRDVERLQASLLVAGYPIGDGAGVFGAETTAALRSMYAAVGFAPPTTDGGRGGRRRLPVASPAELVFVPGLPATVGKIGSRLGSGDLHDAVTLQATQPDLRGEVNPVDAEQLRIGQRVRIDAPDGSATLAGRVRGIGAPRMDETRGRVVPVAIESRRSIAQGRPGTELRVSAATPARTARLYVPTSALDTSADGSIYVTVLTGDETAKVDVDVLGEANGRTSIRPVGGRLSRGDEVVLGVR